ncbi:protein kinase superfamily protein [Actinidia rufa]|uniref:Protein kinase superfamily protein n=1 Tax=Actinidia rufa TaxID=165716 RepID=A0A7J0EA37_9ERIC|nr:protein kinase superfamily protein [Actinidia rufa]
MLWKCFRCFAEDPQQEISVGIIHGKIYSLKELLHATNNFHNDNKIGEGGFGSVYWGRTTKGVEIAVKRLKAMTAKAEMEFAVEVEILGRVRHKNLLGLRGFYAGGDERLIVYDFMPNHSLITHLHGQLAADCLLDWPRRMNIAVGSAEGLAAKKPLEKLPGGIKRDIVQWAKPYVQKGDFEHIADPRLKGKYDNVQLRKVVVIAMRCADGNPENRPSMLQVVEWLKDSVGRRTKRVQLVKDAASEEDDDDEGDGDITDYEGAEMEKSTKRMVRKETRMR